MARPREKGDEGGVAGDVAGPTFQGLALVFPVENKGLKKSREKREGVRC